MIFILDIPFLKRSVVAIDKWDETPEFDKNTNALVLVFNQDVYFYFKRKTITQGTLAHECVHIVHRLMKIVGQESDLLNDEFEAYLVNYIFDNLYDFCFNVRKCSKRKLKSDEKAFLKINKGKTIKE